MAWVKLDDGFAEHPKVLRAGAEGVALWVAGLAYCNRSKRPNGVIITEKVPLLYPVSNALVVAQRLVEVGLWEIVDGGYRIHDYNEFQPLESLRRRRAEAGKQGGSKSGVARRSKREANAKQTRSKHEAIASNPVPVPVPVLKKREPARGTRRLPPLETLTEERIEIGRAAGFDLATIRLEWRKLELTDFPGTRSDWTRVWRKWLLRVRAPSRRHEPPAGAGANQPTVAETRAMLAAKFA